ncbi:uncharacterized protein LOC115442705 isoform X1 [Manduca sexta]|uniref:uncharacterized protein LOC115442705 isoform X1 n=1 Tax=Manduca sexta TaxID=7130 RepID=UPI00188F3AB9|nr:uncharacterized protein LOC115442705 isoform X1 [Manduca sexta]
MWALPVLRTRSYLAAVEFHAHAATLGSLGPCDLYLVNLGSVRCETSIRAPPSRAVVIPWTSSTADQHWSERDGRRSPVPWLKTQTAPKMRVRLQVLPTSVHQVLQPDDPRTHP